MIAQLDTKTVYSFMESLIDIDHYILESKKLGYEAIGIMDKDNLYAAYHFIEKANAANLKPILGLELGLTYRDQTYDLYLIALNTNGYQNLLKLSSLQMSNALTFEKFLDFKENLAIIINYYSGIEELTLPFDFYIGVCEDSPILQTQKKLIPIHTVRYFNQDDTESLQVLKAIKENTLLRETSSIDNHQFLLSKANLQAKFEQKFPNALETLNTLVATINYQFDKSLKLPRFNREIPAKDQLRQLTEKGLKQKNLWQKDYQERLSEELGIISKMGFDDYFLIVWDLLRFGREKGYYMGMGRGSAAGSLVAFSLDITGIDPVKNDLLFERFLNEERFTMPDIDIDLPDIYRSDFLHYVRDKYGSQHAAQIVTFSTFGAKQALRDVLKRFGIPEYELSQFTKKIGFKDDLNQVYKKNIAFKQLINSKLEYQKAFQVAKRIEGNPRQTSIHAAGIVMSDDNLTDHIPLKMGDEMMITQYDAPAVEAVGLLKMDFLGLRNLTLIQKMKEKLLDDKGISIKIEDINLEDKETLTMFANGDTRGIFQFEQNGAIQLLKRIKPSSFEEVVATTSLNRPGASDYIDNFVNRKFGHEKIDLLDPSIASILESTYGIMLYQEQVMQIAQVFAGFTLGKADLLRRAMSKKNLAEMKKMEDSFIKGAIANHHDEAKAIDLFDRMVKFAGYGFNRSHAFAYSALAFQMTYFKAHYPDIFYDIMLNYANGDYLTDAINSGFKIAKMNINTIPFTDKIKHNQIYLGLKQIKNQPRDFSYWIIENRPFRHIEDFLTRLPEKYQQKELILPLVKIGLFDQFEKNRRKIEENLNGLIIFVQELGSLFADSSFSWVECQDYNEAEKFQAEVEVLGVGVSPHPLLKIASLKGNKATSISQLTVNKVETILVEIQSIRLIRTKTNGQQMAFLSVSDLKNKCDVTIFPETYYQVKHLLKEGQYYYLEGKIQERDGRLQMILNKASIATSETFWILAESHLNDNKISSILENYKGNIPVIIHYQDTKETIQSQVHFIEKSEYLQKKLKQFTLKTVFQ